LVVPDDRLSLAIGKKGQNVRLASQLTGWRIDIHSESKVRESEAKSRASLGAIEGVGPDVAEALFRDGWRSAAEIAAAPAGELAHVIGNDSAQIAALKAQAGRAADVERKRDAEEASRRAAEAAALPAPPVADGPDTAEGHA
jgi:N utilization substance protein A